MARTRTPRRPLPAGFRVLWLTVVIDAIGFGIVVPILGLYAEKFGASATIVGLLVAAYSAAQMVAAPVLGRLSDRRGRRPLIIASLVGTAVGSLLTGLAGSLAVLFLGRIVDGASGASVTVARASAADIAEPDDRARLFGLLGAAMGLGFVIGPAIGALAALGDERLPFFLAAAIASVNAVVAWFRLPETRPVDVAGDRVDVAGDRTPAGMSDRPPAGIDLDGSSSAAVPPDAVGPGTERPDVVGRDRVVFYRLLAVTFLSMAAFAGFETTFPLLLDERLSVSLRVVSLLFAAMGIVLVAVRAGLIEPITRALGETQALRLGMVANAAGLAILAVAEEWPPVIAGLVVLIIGQGVLMPVLSSSVASLAQAGRSGGLLGWQQSAQSLARIAGPVLAGVLFSVAIGAPYWAGALMSLVGAALVPAIDRELGRGPAERLPFITKG